MLGIQEQLVANLVKYSFLLLIGISA